MDEVPTPWTHVANLRRDPVFMAGVAAEADRRARAEELLQEIAVKLRDFTAGFVGQINTADQQYRISASIQDTLAMCLQDYCVVNPDDIHVGNKTTCPSCQWEFIATASTEACPACYYLFRVGDIERNTDRTALLVRFTGATAEWLDRLQQQQQGDDHAQDSN